MKTIQFVIKDDSNWEALYLMENDDWGGDATDAKKFDTEKEAKDYIDKEEWGEWAYVMQLEVEE